MEAQRRADRNKPARVLPRGEAARKGAIESSSGNASDTPGGAKISVVSGKIQAREASFNFAEQLALHNFMDQCPQPVMFGPDALHNPGHGHAVGGTDIAACAVNEQFSVTQRAIGSGLAKRMRLNSSMSL